MPTAARRQAVVASSDPTVRDTVLKLSTLKLPRARARRVPETAPTLRAARGCAAAASPGVPMAVLGAARSDQDGGATMAAHDRHPTAAKTMKCVLVERHGGRDDFEEIIRVAEAWPQPTRGRGQLLLRVQACSLAPGDVRTMSGATRFVQTPASGFPYVPGGDVVGLVEEPDPECTTFRKGDCVIARFSDAPSGGLGEYHAVSTSLAALKPRGMSTAEAAALPASVVVAVITVERWLTPGDRVLVLGATGGVGSHAVQLLKSGGASFVAAVARIPECLAARDVDRVINYTQENWWEVSEFQGGNQFDLILDFAAFPDAWANCGAVLKSGNEGGRFVTTAGDSPYFPVRGCWDVLVLMKNIFWRKLWTSCSCVTSAPRYSWFLGGLVDPIMADTWASMFQAIDDGGLRVILDSAGPFPFTEAGVKDAFRLQESRHAHGKVVILIDSTA